MTHILTKTEAFCLRGSPKRKWWIDPTPFVEYPAKTSGALLIPAWTVFPNADTSEGIIIFAAPDTNLTLGKNLTLRVDAEGAYHVSSAELCRDKEAETAHLTQTAIASTTLPVTSCITNGRLFEPPDSRLSFLQLTEPPLVEPRLDSSSRTTVYVIGPEGTGFQLGEQTLRIENNTGAWTCKNKLP